MLAIWALVLFAMLYDLFPTDMMERKVCRYDKNCVPGTIDMHSPPCCSEVGLHKDWNFDYEYKNICCYPSDCPQAKNNPDQCTCIYMVECYTE
jgi:hypothetical protein